MSAITLESFLSEIKLNMDNNTDFFIIKLSRDDIWISSPFDIYYRNNKKQFENYYLSINWERDVDSGKITYYRYNFQRKENKEREEKEENNYEE